MSERPLPFFVGDHLALEFLNTIATPKDVPVEWLRDGADLIHWLERAKAIGAEVASRFRTSRYRRACDLTAQKAREFREWLRGFVTARMGKSFQSTAAALAPLNEWLAKDASHSIVEAVGGEPRLRRVHRWSDPDELLGPIAEAAADLICNEDFQMIRACEGNGCSLLFLDRTKAHRRRWCSMAVCGNRAKAAGHRARKSGE
jgi:predicted RNA-binding Zn ribbon-like protein